MIDNVPIDAIEEVKAYLAKQEPFTITLGKTEVFPPSPSSDGAAVVVVRVESPDLHRIHKELGEMGNWKKSDFSDYKPHMTIAYVKEGTESKYVDLDTLEGIEHEVTELVISDAHEEHHVVKFSRKTGGTGDRNKYIPRTNSEAPSVHRTPVFDEDAYGDGAEQPPIGNITASNVSVPELFGAEDIFESDLPEMKYLYPE